MYDLPFPLRVLFICLSNGIFWTLAYWMMFALFHYLDIHGKYGIFKVSEPETHFKAALKNWKIPFLWGVGSSLIFMCYGLKPGGGGLIGMRPQLLVPATGEFAFLKSPNVLTDMLYAVFGFYLVDFGDYWAHRLGHHFPYLYKKFPFAHFVHHNWTFVNPMVTVSSPIIHPVVLSSSAVYVLLLSQGLVTSVLAIHIVKFLSNHLSHLGCDPFPGLTRLNHKVGGWIPWIPLYHQYHHLHFARQGNYGNLTCLWDYVFGTLIPESVYHIEQGEPTAAVAARIGKSEEQMETEIDRYLQGRMGLSMR